MNEPCRRFSMLGIAALLTLTPTLSPSADEPGTSPRDDPGRLQLSDVFELEVASDPQISPDGRSVVYARLSMDKMSDRRRSALWIVGSDGGEHRPLTAGPSSDTSPRWSPDGRRLAYVSSHEGSSQIHVRWMDTGQSARLTQLERSPSALAWSPDGRWLAFSAFVEERPEPFAELPPKPEGAEWAEPARVVERLIYRADGAGYLDAGHSQVFVVSAEGGTPRQVTWGPYDHEGPLRWTPDGSALVFSANRHEGGELDPTNSEIYRLELETLEVRALTDRHGPDRSPALSPDGRWLAYVGHDERYRGYQVEHLYVRELEGGEARLLTGDFDRDVAAPEWSADGRGLYFRTTDRGNGKVAYVGLEGEVEVLASDLGGSSLGRPYGGGSFSLARDGRFAFTHTRPDHPADVAVGRRGGEMRRLTELNADLFAWKRLGEVEEIVFPSSHDGREIHGWVVKPPGFDPAQQYPLLLEIHGGPFADYGDRFAAEIQLYAAAGYVVLYVNPRGSSSYGEAFGDLIHHAYPGNDYDDLMSGVDAVIERGYVDSERLYVTGGSGGGVLTAWIVGKTDRFRAAVVAKPVINWTSFALTADIYTYFYKFWFPAPPWEIPEQYFARSPLSLVGNVETPTMLLTGEADYRTPISETEQYYQALRLRKVDSVMVRIPGASHGIADRPSQLMAKVAHVLAWFEKYGGGS